MKQIHTIDPVYNENSRILILGSFPSVKSRAFNFYYGHPQNRFWKVMSSLYDTKIENTIDDKKQFLLSNHIALWDVILSCDIEGSSDSSIQDVTPNDISLILNSCNIEQIYVNGKTAAKLYKKYIEPKTKREAVCLPSTSPANAMWTLDKLINAWSVIKSN